MKIVRVYWHDVLPDTVNVEYEDGKVLTITASRKTGQVDVFCTLGNLLMRPVTSNHVILEVERLD